MLVATERGLCAPATPPLPWSSPATLGAKQARPFPAPGRAGSLSPSMNSPGALASVTQGAEAQARERSAGLEGVKPTGSAWAPAVARGRVSGCAGSRDWGWEAALREIKGPPAGCQAASASHAGARGRAGDRGQQQAGCPPDTGGQGGAGPPALVPSRGQRCTARSVAWSSGFPPGGTVTLGCSVPCCPPSGHSLQGRLTSGPPRCPHSNLPDLRTSPNVTLGAKTANVIPCRPGAGRRSGLSGRLCDGGAWHGPRWSRRPR